MLHTRVEVKKKFSFAAFSSPARGFSVMYSVVISRIWKRMCVCVIYFFSYTGTSRSLGGFKTIVSLRHNYIVVRSRATLFVIFLRIDRFAWVESAVTSRV